MTWNADVWDDELTSTLDMLRCAFPGGISPEDYSPLLGALLKRMEPWYVARVVYLYFGKGQDEALSDVHEVVFVAPPDSVKVAGIVQRLQPCGYNMWFEEWEIQPANRSTQRMLECAFPDGLPSGDYLPLMAILREAGFSFRAVAATLQRFAGMDYHAAYNEVMGIEAGKAPEAGAIKRVRQRLIPCGYHKWLDELTR
jgi:hypothetical protein